MFVMMNSERLSCGTQGLGVGEAAYQNAVAYTKERIQGRSVAGPKHPEKPADPIIVHPDIRRALMTMRANNEGCRALGVWVANALDRAARATDHVERAEAEDFIALMTPIVKALFTDLGFESANLGLQTYGGHGYIVDNGMEQLVRDARITLIYEGTNGVQALDLVGRKLPANMGRSLRRFFHPVSEFIEAHAADPEVGPLVQAYAKAFGALQLATAFIAQKSQGDPEEAAAAASDYLRLFGVVALGFMWVAHGEGRGRQAAGGRRGRRVLSREAHDREFLHRADPASGRRLADRDQGRQGFDDGARGSRVLKGARPRHFHYHDPPMSWLEFLAFIVSVLGVWLTTARSLWNFPFSLLSVALYGVIFYQVKLYADMALQAIFAATLLYGLRQWLRGRSGSGQVLVTRIGRAEVAVSLGVGCLAALALGYLLHEHTDASLPWIDSVLLAGSLVASVWAARRNIENWWLWIAVDVLYVGVYLVKHLYLTAVLYAAFVVLAVLGLRRWQAAAAAQGEFA